MGALIETKPTTLSVMDKETEFKASYLHKRWAENKAKSGFHYPSFHISPYKVAPPLKDDGRTYCTNCDLNICAWKDAPESFKTNFYSDLKIYADMQEAWKKRA